MRDSSTRDQKMPHFFENKPRIRLRISSTNCMLLGVGDTTEFSLTMIGFSLIRGSGRGCVITVSVCVQLSQDHFLMSLSSVCVSWSNMVVRRVIFAAYCWPGDRIESLMVRFDQRNRSYLNRRSTSRSGTTARCPGASAS